MRYLHCVSDSNIPILIDLSRRHSGKLLPFWESGPFVDLPTRRAVAVAQYMHRAMRRGGEENTCIPRSAPLEVGKGLIYLGHTRSRLTQVTVVCVCI